MHLCDFLQVFNGCPLKIHCTASWIHPVTHNQHILVGAEEGIYTLNLNEIHENAMDLLYPRRTVWMFVIKDVLMTLSGTTPTKGYLDHWQTNTLLARISVFSRVFLIILFVEISTTWPVFDNKIENQTEMKNTLEDKNS